MRTGCEGGSKMNGVQGSNRFNREWLSCPLDYVAGDMQDVPL